VIDSLEDRFLWKAFFGNGLNHLADTDRWMVKFIAWCLQSDTYRGRYFLPCYMKNCSCSEGEAQSKGQGCNETL